jgi:hypothetical protein
MARPSPYNKPTAAVTIAADRKSPDTRRVAGDKSEIRNPKSEIRNGTVLGIPNS